MYGQGFFPGASRGGSGFVFDAVHRATLPLASPGILIWFFKVGIVSLQIGLQIGPATLQCRRLQCCRRATYGGPRLTFLHYTRLTFLHYNAVDYNVVDARPTVDHTSQQCLTPLTTALSAAPTQLRAQWTIDVHASPPYQTSCWFYNTGTNTSLVLLDSGTRGFLGCKSDSWCHVLQARPHEKRVSVRSLYRTARPGSLSPLKIQPAMLERE